MSEKCMTVKVVIDDLYEDENLGFFKIDLPATREEIVEIVEREVMPWARGEKTAWTKQTPDAYRFGLDAEEMVDYLLVDASWETEETYLRIADVVFRGDYRVPGSNIGFTRYGANLGDLNDISLLWTEAPVEKQQAIMAYCAHIAASSNHTRQVDIFVIGCMLADENAIETHAYEGVAGDRLMTVPADISNDQIFRSMNSYAFISRDIIDMPKGPPFTENEPYMDWDDIHRAAEHLRFGPIEEALEEKGFIPFAELDRVQKSFVLSDEETSRMDALFNRWGLDKLAEDPSERVRMHVAAFGIPELCEKLAHDPDPDVRKMTVVAGNTWRELDRDPDDSVRRIAQLASKRDFVLRKSEEHAPHTTHAPPTLTEIAGQAKAQASAQDRAPWQDQIEQQRNSER